MINAANIITGFRIVFSAALLFCPVFSPVFYILYSAAGITDMIDGTFARKINTISKSGETLVFFIIFFSFCFSAMIQMSASMKDLASEMMGFMIFVIGVVLAFTTLYIAVSTVIRSKQKNIAMMRVFGYESAECKRSVLDGCRPAAYIGFVIGSVYQYGLLRVMVDIVFAGVEGVPGYEFDFAVCFITLAVFIVVYEGIMFAYGQSMKRIPLKQIMSK